MLALKIVSMIYTSLVLMFFISSDCKAKDASESIGSKILLLLQAGTLAYIVMN